jgi:hypothetical protein
VPFRRRNEVARGALADRERMRHSVLRHRIALLRRAPDHREAERLFLLHALPQIERDAIFQLGIRDTRLGRLAKPVGGHPLVARHARSILIKGGQIILRRRVIELRRTLHELRGLFVILRPRIAFHIDQRQIVDRDRVIFFRRQLEELRGLFLVLLDAAPLGQHDAERELRVYVAELGAFRVPFRRFHKVLRNAEPVFVNHPQQGVRWPIALRGASFGKCPVLDIATIFEGRVGQIRGGLLGRRRDCGLVRALPDLRLRRLGRQRRLRGKHGQQQGQADRKAHRRSLLSQVRRLASNRG